METQQTPNLTRRARDVPARRALAVALCFAVSLGFGCGVAGIGGPSGRDFLIVVDTSGSMARDKLLEQVKVGVRRLLDETARKNDSVTLYSFDEDLEARGSFTLSEPDSRARLMQSVEALSVQPRNTDMVKLILRLRDISRQSQRKDRDQVIVILSDGEDAPDPRGRSRPRLDLAKFRSPEKFPVQEKYIYYVALRNQQTAGMVAGLEGAVGGKVKPIGKGGPDEVAGAIGTDLSIQALWKLFLTYWPYLAGLVGLILVVLLALFFLARYRRANQPEGFLMFYEDGVQSPMKSALRLDRIQSNRFVIGARTGADFRVRGLGSNDLFAFRCRREKDRCRLQPTGPTGAKVQPLVQKEKGFFQFGDRFKIGNFVFEYTETQN